MADPPLFGKGRNERVFAVVRRIPSGRVATYGQVARLAGLGSHARQVGYALHALPDNSTVPWHRVVNAKGLVSRRSGGDSAIEQRFRLAKEGVLFSRGGAIDLGKHRWSTDAPIQPASRPITSGGLRGPRGARSRGQR